MDAFLEAPYLIGSPPTPKSIAQNAYLFEFFILHQLVLLQLNIFYIFLIFFLEIFFDGEPCTMWWHSKYSQV